MRYTGKAQPHGIKWLLFSVCEFQYCAIYWGMMPQQEHYRMGWVVIVGTLALGMTFWSATARAEDQRKKTDRGTFSVQLENDMFSGSDRHYTNGLRGTWLSPKDGSSETLAEVHDFLLTTMNALPGISRKGDNDEARFSFSIGQDIYTPEDKTRTDLIVNDRPYAGWLYAAAAVYKISDPGNGWKSQDALELALGVVGPSALGQEAQDLVHEIRLIDKFEGWHNQLENEPGILALYEHKQRIGKPVPFIIGEADIIPSYGFLLGNISTQANIGGTVRWGVNLGENFGPPSLIRGAAPYYVENRKTAWEDLEAYVFVSAQGRYVARNIFLDGNTFRDSHSVDKKPWVGDLAVGFSLEVGPFNLTYANAFRSKEFDGQNRFSRFGAVTVSWHWEWG